MHRSGTSLLVRILKDLGVFFGCCRDEHDEARFFQELNVWLLKQCGARWDTPEQIDYLWKNDALLSVSESYIRTIVDGPRAIQFLGAWRYMLGQRICELGSVWGWKDPRNTYTFPIWHKIFPKARVINITRHGVDVAQSLVTRSEKGFNKTSARFQKYKSIVAVHSKKGGFIESPRCATLLKRSREPVAIAKSISFAATISAICSDVPWCRFKPTFG